jgi:hypothetical protein
MQPRMRLRCWQVRLQQRPPVYLRHAEPSRRAFHVLRSAKDESLLSLRRWRRSTAGVCGLRCGHISDHHHHPHVAAIAEQVQQIQAIRKDGLNPSRQPANVAGSESKDCCSDPHYHDPRSGSCFAIGQPDPSDSDSRRSILMRQNDPTQQSTRMEKCSPTTPSRLR